MITRAQAEALLTLAESLEACERQGLTVEAVTTFVEPHLIFRHKAGGFAMDLGKHGEIKPMLLRLRIAEEIPRQEP